MAIDKVVDRILGALAAPPWSALRAAAPLIQVPKGLGDPPEAPFQRLRSAGAAGTRFVLRRKRHRVDGGRVKGRT